MIPVVISGGSGTRLWPLSRTQFPKQFCSLFAEPLQSMTLQRCQKLGAPWVLTGAVLKTLTEINLQRLGFKDVPVIYEPMGRNTGPAVAALCRLFELQGRAAEVVGIFPSDHLVKNEKSFLATVRWAESFAQKDRVVTLGISPTYPETGYGYIQAEKLLDEAGPLKAFSVTRFHEKPELKKAEEFLRAGGYSWNAGMFIFKVEVMIEHFKKHQPALWKTLESLRSDFSNAQEIYQKLPSISLDYAIIEHLSAEELVCIPSDMGWSDVGSWEAVANEPTSLKSPALTEKSENNYVFCQNEKTVALVGVSDLVIVETADSLLVAKKGSGQDVKKIVDQLLKTRPAAVHQHNFEDRPWGRFEILRDSENFKSKIITVNPQAQISYQSHARREEHWIVTSGRGEVILNDEKIPVGGGTYIFIPLGAKHRIRNTGSEALTFVEVQLGTYFGEDDIVRYKDDYQRV